MARKPFVPLGARLPCDEVVEGDCKPDNRTVKAMISNREGNSINQEPDGIYAPAIVYRENTSVIAADDSVEVTEGETLGGFREFSVGTRISVGAGNILELREDGLFVSVEMPEDETQYIAEGAVDFSGIQPGHGVLRTNFARSLIRFGQQFVHLHMMANDPLITFSEIYLNQNHNLLIPFTLHWEADTYIQGVQGPQSVTFAPGSSVHLIKHNTSSWSLLGGAGVNEAPFDNKPYVRENGVWVLQHDQVLPALMLGEPYDAIPLDVSASQFNRIVNIHDRFTELNIHREYIGLYQEDFEATYTKRSRFSIKFPMGVTVNGFAGPLSFRVDAQPRGAVLKKVGYDKWLLLGAANQEGTEVPVVEVITQEWPGSGLFGGVARQIDNELLYDMTLSSTVASTVHAIKNIVIAMIVIDEKGTVLEAKDLIYLDRYKTGVHIDDQSDLVEGAVVSFRDLLTLLLLGKKEDVAVMISELLGDPADYLVFVSKMNTYVNQFESPLVTSFYSAAVVQANPVGTSNVHMMAKWLQHLEENYEVLRSMLRNPTRTFTFFGPNTADITTPNHNQYLAWERVDYGVDNIIDTGGLFTGYGLVAKLEYPSNIPVYIGLANLASELELHYAFTSGMLGLEDQFPYLTGGVSEPDGQFTNVVLMIGNGATLRDRSNIQNQVSLSPTGAVVQERDTKGWIRGYQFNGVAGYIQVHDGNTLRMKAADFTIEMFLRGNGDKPSYTLFSKYSTASADWGYKLQVIGDDLVFTYMVEGEAAPVVWTLPFNKAVVMNGARRHLTLQRIGDELSIYINGRLLGSHTMVADAFLRDTSAPFVIGADNDPFYGVAPTAGMYGLFILDNIRITKTVARYPQEGFPVQTTPFKTGSGA